MQATQFTIIIPTLNEERYLPGLLEDLNQQTYSDFTVIVVDGQSKDKTQRIVKEWQKKDTRFNLLVSPKRGVGFQRNLGAQQAKTQFILFFDADNRIPSYYLEGLHYRLLINPSDTFTTWAKPDTKNRQDRMMMNTVNILLEAGAKAGTPLAIGACIGCTKTVFDLTGGFDSAITYMEDSEFIQRVMKQGYNFTVYHDPMYTYSFRRMRKEGTLQLYRTVPYLIRQIFNQKITEPVTAYPMLGGSYFEEKSRKKKKRSLLRVIELQKISRKINKSRKKIVRRMIQEIST